MREEEMIRRYKGIVISVWNKYFNDCTAIEKEDLIQYGYIGLIKAYRNFDSSKGKLSSHLYTNVYNAMKTALREYGNNIASREDKMNMKYSEIKPFSYYEYNKGKEHIEGKDYIEGKLFKEKTIIYMEDKEDYTELYGYINKLTEQKRKIIYLIMQGYKKADIVNILGIRYNQYESIRKSALEELKGMLEGKEVKSKEIKLRKGNCKNKVFPNLDKEIKLQAKEKGMKVKDFCEEVIGINKITIEKWMRGDSKPRVNKIDMVCNKLGKNKEYLFG